jgi:crotonobetainyl-CoA:carnitine CoA-transferase CaiB-like acyl-CoA transferase
MTKVLEGIRVLELSQYGFVPGCGAVLADWGADVIKIDHAGQEDPIRGLASFGIGPGTGGIDSFVWDTLNRGKRTMGIDLGHDAGRAVFLHLVGTADVFLTSMRRPARVKLGIEPDDLRAVNPTLIYARGSGLGPRGEERDKGGFDSVTYWYRCGVSSAVTPDGHPHPLPLAAPAFGDIQSGAMLAGGVAAAIAYRERTGQGTVVDGSLLNSGLWAMQLASTGTEVSGRSELKPDGTRGVTPGNPLVNPYRTADGRFIALGFTQPDRHFPSFCEVIGRPELLDDTRWASAAARRESFDHCQAYLDELFASKPLEKWREILSRQSGEWEVIRYASEIRDDPQARANGFVQDVAYDDGRTLALVAAPAQFDEEAPELRPAPRPYAHTDEILAAAGLDAAEIRRLKDAGSIR